MSYKKQASESAAPTFTKEQLMGSKTLGLPRTLWRLYWRTVRHTQRIRLAAWSGNF